ncbi:MAG: Water stress and hypersensitive response domain-containing protein [Desulfuromonadaceae bacterium]|nr:Water stress and hypersensitive response domain-containing protein [Desulfuromonadaceae bacterium]
MSTRLSILILALVMQALLSGGCAILQSRAPVDVILAGVEPLQGQGLEIRMLVKLRIQNPNDVPLDFNGMSVQMDVRGRRFATGVSDAAGSLPRFGETIVDVPVSISVFRIARQAMDVVTNEYHGTLPYEITGRLSGPGLHGVRFRSQGELILPSEIFKSGKRAKGAPDL